MHVYDDMVSLCTKHQNRTESLEMKKHIMQKITHDKLPLQTNGKWMGYSTNIAKPYDLEKVLIHYIYHMNLHQRRVDTVVDYIYSHMMLNTDMF